MDNFWFTVAFCGVLFSGVDIDVPCSKSVQVGHGLFMISDVMFMAIRPTSVSRNVKMSDFLPVLTVTDTIPACQKGKGEELSSTYQESTRLTGAGRLPPPVCASMIMHFRFELCSLASRIQLNSTEKGRKPRSLCLEADCISVTYSILNTVEMISRALLSYNGTIGKPEEFGKVKTNIKTCQTQADLSSASLEPPRFNSAESHHRWSESGVPKPK